MLSFEGFSQFGYEKQFNAFNRKKEFKLSITGIYDVEINVSAISSYDFMCHANIIDCSLNQVTRNDTAVFIDLRPGIIKSDSNLTKSMIIHQNERLSLRIDKNQGIRVKKKDVVYFLLLINNETWYLKSKYYKRSFCRKRFPPATGEIKL